MSLYLKELVKILDAEDKNWRNTTILFHDGASYASSDSTANILRALRVPFMLLPPHAYNVSPIELVFGAIKTNILNP